MSTDHLGRLPFYLTQRITRRESARAKGFDQHFECQYMGSAEFEWGAIPDSLTRIRAARKIGIYVGRVTRNKTTAPVFVVGEVKRIADVPDALTQWMKDARPHGKEVSYFPEHVEGLGLTNDWHLSTHAWWALRSDVMWTLEADTADLLLKAIGGRP